MDTLEKMQQDQYLGLYSFDSALNKEYWFTLVAKYESLLEFIGADHYKIDIMALWERFEFGVELYLADLKSESDLQNKFSLLFHKYGSVYIYFPLLTSPPILQYNAIKQL